MCVEVSARDRELVADKWQAAGILVGSKSDVDSVLSEAKK